MGFYFDCYFCRMKGRTISMCFKKNSPIVPVLKPDGSLCICGDYKVNPNANNYQYPLSRTEDLFATLHTWRKKVN